MQKRPFNSASAMTIYLPSKRMNEWRITLNPIRAFRNWRMYSETVRELNKLNSRQLNDLGINRADIETIARKAI
jgi:uncharacterized protein YjiS (DUF1127 family)